jgi:hypothetical protein
MGGLTGFARRRTRRFLYRGGRQLICVHRCPRPIYKLALLFLFSTPRRPLPAIPSSRITFDVRSLSWRLFYTVAQVSVMIDSIWNIYLTFWWLKSKKATPTAGGLAPNAALLRGHGL